MSIAAMVSHFCSASPIHTEVIILFISLVMNYALRLCHFFGLDPDERGESTAYVEGNYKYISKFIMI